MIKIFQNSGLWRVAPVAVLCLFVGAQSAQAQNAAQTSVSPTKTITFEDIYAAPDDQDLNLAYAEQQADAGRLLQAAASLERMLYSNRDWDSARLFYALVLLRLDDRIGTQREVRLLQTRPLNGEDAALLARIVSALDGGETIGTGNDFSGRLSIAGRYDDNAGGVFGDIVFGGNDQPDESVQLQGVLRYSTPVGNAGASAFMRATGNVRLHAEETDADFSAFGLAAGIRGKSGRLEYSAQAETTFVDIARDNYLDQAGLAARIGASIGSGVTLGLRGSWLNQNYDDLDGSPNASERSGDLFQVGPYVDWRPVSKLRLSASARYQDKSAEDDGLAYDGWRLDSRAKLTLSEDVYLSARADYRSLEYKADNVFVFPTGPREDEYVSGRAAVGVNAAALVGGEALRAVTIEAAINYNSRETNIPGRGYSNTGGELRLVYDF